MGAGDGPPSMCPLGSWTEDGTGSVSRSESWNLVAWSDTVSAQKDVAMSAFLCGEPANACTPGLRFEVPGSCRPIRVGSKTLGKPVLWWFGATRRRATAVNSKHAGPAFRKHRAKASFRHRAKWDEAAVASA